MLFTCKNFMFPILRGKKCLIQEMMEGLVPPAPLSLQSCCGNRCNVDFFLQWHKKRRIANFSKFFDLILGISNQIKKGFETMLNRKDMQKIFSSNTLFFGFTTWFELAGYIYIYKYTYIIYNHFRWCCVSSVLN